MGEEELIREVCRTLTGDPDPDHLARKLGYADASASAQARGFPDIGALFLSPGGSADRILMLRDDLQHAEG